MSEKVQFVDFGAPDKFGTHLFRVEIPAVRTEPVQIVEDFGYRGLEGGIPRDEDGAVPSSLRFPMAKSRPKAARGGARLKAISSVCLCLKSQHERPSSSVFSQRCPHSH